MSVSYLFYKHKSLLLPKEGMLPPGDPHGSIELQCHLNILGFSFHYTKKLKWLIPNYQLLFGGVCVCLYACACRTSKKENVHNWYCLNVYSWSWDHSWYLKIPSSINHFLFPLPSLSQDFSWSVLYLARWPTQTLICDGSESCSFCL